MNTHFTSSDFCADKLLEGVFSSWIMTLHGSCIVYTRMCLAEWSAVCGRVRPAWNADVGSHVPRSPRRHSDSAEAPSAQHTSSAPPLWTFQGSCNSCTSDEAAEKASNCMTLKQGNQGSNFAYVLLPGEYVGNLQLIIILSILWRLCETWRGLQDVRNILHCHQRCSKSQPQVRYGFTKVLRSLDMWLLRSENGRLNRPTGIQTVRTAVLLTPVWVKW